MKKLTQTRQGRFVLTPVCSFRAGVLLVLILIAGGVTAIAKYESRVSGWQAAEKPLAVANPAPGRNYVSVEVRGKQLLVNPQALQQGPLTPEQAQQMADALKNNQSTDGLVQVQHADGTVSIDLQDRFQNVVMAKKNEDGSVSQACVDNAKAASAFLQSGDPNHQPEPGSGRRSPVKE